MDTKSQTLIPAADPGQDQRGAAQSPLWTILDQTPGGRPADWYPKLDYA
ncbi:MAG TPA: hypothetical protein VII73_13890 [Caulobacteraceae bacterium]